MESARLNAKQYFLYLGGFYFLMCAIGAMVTSTDTAPPKPHILEGLGYLLIKGLVMFVPGLKFKSWLKWFVPDCRIGRRRRVQPGSAG